VASTLVQLCEEQRTGQDISLEFFHNDNLKWVKFRDSGVEYDTKSLCDILEVRALC
jgi:hypothetical protein